MNRPAPRRLLPTVFFETQGGNTQRFLSECLRRFIPLQNIQATPYGLRAGVPARWYGRLRAPARRHGCRLRITQKQGLFFRTRRLRRHVGAAVGLALAAAALALGRGMVWNIEYYGVPAAQRQRLSDSLFACGVYQGCFASDELLRAAEDTILVQSREYAALSLNFTKGKLIVEARTLTQAPSFPQVLPRDMRTTQAGVVRSVEVYSGVAAVAPGQTVRPGDVLVYASWPDQAGRPVAAPCRARIMAYVERTCCAACPLEQSVQTVSATRTDSLALCIGGRRLWLKKGGDAAATPAQQGVHLLGMALPLTLYRTLSPVRTQQSVTLTREEARGRCVDALNAMLYAQLPGMQPLSREYSCTVQDGTLYCTLHLRAYADLAAAAAAAGASAADMQQPALSVWDAAPAT